MKSKSPKLLLIALASALGIAAMFTSPASAQYRQPTRHERMSQAPTYGQQQNPDIPHYGDAPYDQRDDW
ncbi:MAG TPA: hypothetical protein VGG11_08130 [Xanthobacteraceae bacterium]|jgi:hypothetical protein